VPKDRTVAREPDLSAEASFALGWLFVAVLLVLHLGSWFFLMLDRPGGGFHQTTAWTFVFFVPELILAAGVVAAAAVPRPTGRLFAACFVAAVAALGLIVYLYASHPARSWSLPVVPPFGGGSP
jgi:hypothetical protein